MPLVADGIPPEAFLAAYPAEIAAIAERLRAVVRDAVPEATERVRPGWRLIGYDVPRGRRAAYFCFVAPEPEHVHLGFEHGTTMRDPTGRLRGAGITRQVRWLTFRPGTTLDVSVLAPLVREAARVALMSRAERLAEVLTRQQETLDK
jgi:hypothetical protein